MYWQVLDFYFLSDTWIFYSVLFEMIVEDTFFFRHLLNFFSFESIFLLVSAGSVGRFSFPVNPFILNFLTWKFVFFSFAHSCWSSCIMRRILLPTIGLPGQKLECIQIHISIAMLHFYKHPLHIFNDGFSIKFLDLCPYLIDIALFAQWLPHSKAMLGKLACFCATLVLGCQNF